MNVKILENLLVEAEKAHKQFETDNGGQADPHWPRYYAKYLETQLWRAGNLTHSQLQGQTPKSLNCDYRANWFALFVLAVLFSLGWYVEGIDDGIRIQNPQATWNPVTEQWRCPLGYTTTADPHYQDNAPTCR